MSDFQTASFVVSQDLTCSTGRRVQPDLQNSIRGKFTSIRGETIEVIQRGLKELEEQGKIKDVPLDWLKKLCGDAAGRDLVDLMHGGRNLTIVSYR